MKYDFTGKERDDQTTYDYFGARYYDSRVANWTSIDPLFEKHYDYSPFNYVLRSPLVLIDPDGKQESFQLLTTPFINYICPTCDIGGSPNSGSIAIGSGFNSALAQGIKFLFDKGLPLINVYKILNNLSSSLNLNLSEQAESIEWFSSKETEEINVEAEPQEGDAPSADRVYVDKKGKEYKYTPPKNWDGKKNNEKLYPSAKTNEKGWSKFTKHKGTHEGHFDIQLKNGRHISVKPKN